MDSDQAAATTSIALTGVHGVVDTALLRQLCAATSMLQSLRTKVHLGVAPARESQPQGTSGTPPGVVSEFEATVELVLLDIGEPYESLEKPDEATPCSIDGIKQLEPCRPRICRVVLSGVSSGFSPHGYSIAIQDMVMQDLRSLRPEYEAIVQQRVSAPGNEAQDVLSVQCALTTGVHALPWQCSAVRCAL